jgi:GDP-mannose 6-dehydrogenase
MKISVFGLGYVGTVVLGCLAKDGHQVIGVDVDPIKLGLLRQGKAPIIEEGIQELIAEQTASGRVSVTEDPRAAVLSSDLSLLCVGTPSAPGGGQNLDATLHLSRQLGEALREKRSFHVFVMRSTVIPGTVEERMRPILEETSGLRSGRDFALCYQPEFLREGASIRDYFNPPYTVIAGDHPKGLEMLRSLYANLPGEIVETSIRAAEMLKFACNSFHGLKVAFANEIGRVCHDSGLDARVVMDLVCKDTKLNVSRAYLAPGFAFGGSCLPKDLRALVHRAESRGVPVPMLAAVLPSNHAHVEHTARVVRSAGRDKVGMIGLSFKGGTDDLRESPLVTLAELLIEAKLPPRIYDPEVNLSRLIGANRRYIEESIPHVGSLMESSCEAVLEHADVIVVGLLNPPIRETLRQRLETRHVVVDLVGMNPPPSSVAAYHGVCW